MQSLKWDEEVAAAWKHTYPPCQPSPSELQIIERYVKELNGNPKVLILGSTPQFRDLLLKHGLKPTCVDYNRTNFHILKRMMKQRGKEKLIISDWREMELDEDYDLVLGDLSFQMVPLGDNEKIFRILRGALTEDGKIIHRNWMRIPNAYQDVSEILKERRRNAHPLYSFAIPLIQHCYDDRKGSVLFAQRIVPYAEILCKNGYLTKTECNAIGRCWKFYQIPNYLPTKKEFERLAKKYFKIEGIRYGRNWFSKFCPIYILRKSAD